MVIGSNNERVRAEDGHQSPQYNNDHQSRCAVPSISPPPNTHMQDKSVWPVMNQFGPVQRIIKSSNEIIIIILMTVRNISLCSRGGGGGVRI